MAKKKRFGASLYIGESLNGLPSPIFFDPHYATRINKSPVITITGGPGSGKTFASSVFVAQASVMNKVSFVIDPKGDLLSLKELERQKMINKTYIWSIFDHLGGNEVNEENYGLLDPMTLSNSREENITLTLDVIQELTGKFTDEEKNIILALVRDTAESPKPLFSRVIQRLMSHSNSSVRAVGNDLDTKCGLPVGKLLVSNSVSEVNPFRKNDGLMIVSLLGLTLPPSSKPYEEYTDMETMSISIMKLITYSISNTMKRLPKTTEKMLFIDEAWAVLNTASGRALVEEISLLGRSLNMALILATQSPQHFSIGNSSDKKSSLDTTVTTRFAFRNENDEDNKLTRKLMRLPENEGWEEIFPKLHSGQCILQDAQGNYAIIKIITTPEWAAAFETNPTELLNKENH